MPIENLPQYRFNPIFDSRHPTFVNEENEWSKWRLSFRGGEAFRLQYLKKFDTREDDGDFNRRRELTPLPTYAKSAILDIRNAVFQRLGDVSRTGGSRDYQSAVEGENGGVDNLGSNMNYFLGHKVLEDLLVMGKIGIFVDMPPAGSSMVENLGKRPYLYFYQREDILNWTQGYQGNPAEFSTLLLRDTAIEYDEFDLPKLETKRLRYLYMEEGKVKLHYIVQGGQTVDVDGKPTDEPITLELSRIPFVMLDIGDSLMKDVADDQIALMNLVSSDINYALKSNFPFYTEQQDPRAVGGHIKKAASDGSATTGGQGADDNKIKVGVTQGRTYTGERPGFIAPPTAPLEVSMKRQEMLEHDIRKKCNLAVQNLGARASAESKEYDNQGLDAGLSFIGLVLEGGENRIAEMWAAYEDRVPTRRRVAKVKYPEHWSLKNDKERIEESDKLSDLANKFTSNTARREIQKQSVNKLLGGKIKSDTLQKIYKEIDDAEYTTSDPKVINEAKNAGLVSVETAALALGFDPEEAEKAIQDHVERLKRIQEAQTPPEVRGVPDTSGDPTGAGREEKELSRNTDMQGTTTQRVRGEGR